MAVTIFDLYYLTYPISFLIYLAIIFLTWINYLKSDERYSFKDEYADGMIIGLLFCLPAGRELILVLLTIIGAIAVSIFWLNTIRKYFLLFYISRQKDPATKETIRRQAERNKWIG